MISIRLTKEENEKLEELKEITGLSTTALIKKRLFGDGDALTLNKDIPMRLGSISTCINMAKRALEFEEYNVIRDYLDKTEKEVLKLWQSL